MEIRIDPSIDAQLTHIAEISGRAKDDIIEEALAGYLDATQVIQKEIDSRYDEAQRGEVTPIPLEEAFQKLRERIRLRSERA